jgi:hypothetical protein
MNSACIERPLSTSSACIEVARRTCSDDKLIELPVLCVTCTLCSGAGLTCWNQEIETVTGRV